MSVTHAKFSLDDKKYIEHILLYLYLKVRQRLALGALVG